MKYKTILDHHSQEYYIIHRCEWLEAENLYLLYISSITDKTTVGDIISILIDSISYILLKFSDSFVSTRDEKGIYILKPTFGKHTFGSKLTDKIKPFTLAKGTFGTIICYPFQNIVLKATNEKRSDIPKDVLKELVAYNLLENTGYVPKLYYFDLGGNDNIPKLIFERGKYTLDVAYKKFTEKQSRTAMFKIAKMFKHISEQGIIHCDIKPGNIIVSQSGDFQVIDWGLSEIDVRTYRSRIKSISGTLTFQAPELVCETINNKVQTVYSNKVDIFSLGILFLEIHNKKYEYDREDITEEDYLNMILTKCYGMDKEKYPGRIMNKLIYGVEKICTTEISLTLEKEFGIKDRILSDLISRMIHPNPVLRYSFKEILTHPYFKNIPKERDKSVKKISMPEVDIEDHWKKNKFALRERSIILDWLHSTNLYYKFSDETLFLSIRLLDLCMIRVRALPGTLKSCLKQSIIQSVCQVCHMLASKIFESDHLTVNTLAKSMIVKTPTYIALEKEIVKDICEGVVYIPEIIGNNLNTEKIKELYKKKDIYNSE
jgi:serine/threonine protein kinase